MWSGDVRVMDVRADDFAFRVYDGGGVWVCHLKR
jgi:hypothetical protein